MKVDVKFEGGLELSKALAELGDESTVAGRRALRETANELRDALRETAPRGTAPTKKSWRRKDGSVGSADYGRLHENIRTREVKARRDNTVAMQVTTGDAFWGSFREFGTSKQPARPWMRPVFDRMHNSLIARLSDSLGKQIENAAKRIERRKRKALKNGGGL